MRVDSLVVLVLAVFVSINAQAQRLDTLIEAGGYKLHFVITKGKGVPILFEAGGGEDASTWKKIIQPVSEITETTLITYDRAGFGKSSFDTSQHGILKGIKGLETGLNKLGYKDKFVLVAHSQGGIYARLFASRHPAQVKAVVLIDATTTCFYGEKRLAATQQMINQQNTEQIKASNPGIYYQGVDFSQNIETVRKVDFPAGTPVIDFVSDYPPFDDSSDVCDWKRCHKEFAAASPDRTGIIAYGCGHFIYNNNPPLVINAIVKAFNTTLDRKDHGALLERELKYNIKALNQRKMDEIAYRHSEDDLNSWGYALMKTGDLQKALQVFRLNVELHSDSWNVYDSYGEALAKSGQKDEAIRMYQRSLELNPGNEKGRKKLEMLMKEM